MRIARAKLAVVDLIRVTMTEVTEPTDEGREYNLNAHRFGVARVLRWREQIGELLPFPYPPF